MLNNQEFLLLRLDAMRSVYRDDADYTLRAICRWYSEHYHTPLHEVGTPNGKVDLEDVLKTFYEVRYNDMEDTKREEEIQVLLRTPAEAAEVLRAADLKEMDDWEFNRMVERQVIAKRAAEERQKGQEKIEDVPTATGPVERDRVLMNRPIPEASLSGVVPRPPVVAPPPQQLPGVAAATRQMPAQTSLPENVKIVFMTEEEMEADAVDPFSVEKPPQSRKKPKKP